MTYNGPLEVQLSQCHLFCHAYPYSFWTRDYDISGVFVVKDIKVTPPYVHPMGQSEPGKTIWPKYLRNVHKKSINEMEKKTHQNKNTLNWTNWHNVVRLS